MNTLSPADLHEALNWRYATKMFDPGKKLSKETFDALLESLQLSPSSIGIQPWKFIVVQDPEIRKQLLPVSYNQTQVTDASHLIVLCTRKGEYINEEYLDQFVARVAEVQGKTVDDLAPFKEMMFGYMKMHTTPEARMIWAQKQVYIALGELMTSAAVMGVDTCPMEGFVPDKYDEILGLTDSMYTSTVVCPVGYRSEDDKYGKRPKVRFALEDVVEYR